MNLFPELIAPNLDLAIPPDSETSMNASLEMGTPHCLKYGFVKEQLDVESEVGRKGANPNAREGEQRGRPRQRVLLKKRTVKKSRSRSRSPLSDDDDDDVNLTNQLMKTRPNAKANPNMFHLLNNPNDYLLFTKSHFTYFEPHKPDLVLVWTKESPSNSTHHIAKFVCEISSWNKEARSNVSLEKHVDSATEQCIQSCLAAMAFDQTFILGIVIVVDGMKLIKIEQEDDGQQLVYNIRETRLISWDRKDYLYILFGIIKEAIIN